MALETLEGLPEEVASLYKKGEDGKFHLEGNDGLKSALQKERDARQAAEKALKAEAEAKTAREKEAEEAKARATGDFEKLKLSMEAEAKAAKEEAAAYKARILTERRDRAAMEAIVAANGIPEALMPHVTSHLEVVPEGDDFKVLVKGNPAKKVTDFVASLKDAKPWGFQPSGANGGGTPANGGTPNGTKTLTRTDFDKLSPSAKSSHVKAGGAVTD